MTIPQFTSNTQSEALEGWSGRLEACATSVVWEILLQCSRLQFLSSFYIRCTTVTCANFSCRMFAKNRGILLLANSQIDRQTVHQIQLFYEDPSPQQLMTIPRNTASRQQLVCPSPNSPAPFPSRTINFVTEYNLV